MTGFENNVKTKLGSKKKLHKLQKLALNVLKF